MVTCCKIIGQGGDSTTLALGFEPDEVDGVDVWMWKGSSVENLKKQIDQLKNKIKDLPVPPPSPTAKARGSFVHYDFCFRFDFIFFFYN